MLGIMGILLAIATLIFIAYKGWGAIPASIAASLIVVVSSQVDIWESFSVSYAEGVKVFAGAYLMIFVLGSLFGQVMGDSGSAKSLSYKIIDVFGAKRAILITVFATAVLTYGGVNVFIVIFTVFPIAKILFEESKLPKKLIFACIGLGAGTFTMTALPASPAIQNLIPTTVLGTTASAAPMLGIIAATLLAGLGYTYLHIQGSKYQTYDVEIGTNTKKEWKDASLPDWKKALLPMVLVVGLIVALKDAFPPMYTVSIALFAAIVVTYLLNWKRIKNPLNTLNVGTANSVHALINTACIVGFGFVVKSVPAFQEFINYALGLKMHPYYGSIIAVNIVAGIVGSSSGGLTIFMQTMGKNYLDMGVNPELLHRISALASGGLDSLPHSGAVITMLSVMGLTHKEAYKEWSVVTVIIPIFVTVVTASIAFLIY